jgi:transposase-like protein
MGKNLGQRHFTPEERLELITKACDLYASDGATIESCCDACGLRPQTFYLWVCKYKELGEIYKKAKTLSDEVFFERLRPRAQDALIKLIEGETFKKTKIETGVTATGPIDKTVVEEVKVHPNVTAAIFALKGLHPDTFTDRKDITTNGESLNEFSKIPLEKRLRIIEILEEESSEDDKTT